MRMKNQQLAKQTPTGWRKTRQWMKRWTARLARRLGKLLREDAPQRRTEGWSD
jgi:hypothetical protein